MSNNILGTDEVTDELSPRLVLKASSERWRFFAYLWFWAMCAFAILMTNLYVKDLLAAGPEDGLACGPFNRNSSEFGVYPGEGFDFDTQSHLIQLFGFANICANWDYSPSRELTAMFYPCFEYSLLVYLILDFWATALAKQRGEIPNWFWRLSQAFFPITVFLCAQFRMIFVAIAYIDVKQHTAGFWGLQLALIMVAIHNCLFILVSGISYNWLGGRQGTKYACIAYLVCDMLISGTKLAATTFVVRFGFGAPWTLRPTLWDGIVTGQVVDWIWMLFNAILPLILSFHRSRSEAPLEIIIKQDRRLRHVPEPDYANQANLWIQKEKEGQFKMNTISRVVELRKKGVPDSQIVEWFPEAEPFISNIATDGEETVAPENPVGEILPKKARERAGMTLGA